MRSHMNKSIIKGILAIIMLVILCFSFSACKNNTDVSTLDSPSSISGNETTKSPEQPTTTPINKDIQSSTIPTTMYLDGSLSYRSYQPTEELTVYISEDSNKQQIIISNKSITLEYNWEYNLNYGEPIVKIDSQDNTSALYIILPTKDSEPILNTNEICGIAHVINPTTLEEFPFSNDIEFLKEWTSIEYSIPWNDTIETFSLMISPNWSRQYFYSGIQLPSNETYEVVFEDTSHFSETLMEYRRVGFKLDNDIIWLGKFCDDITQTNINQNITKENNYLCSFIFLPYDDILYTKEDGLTFNNTLSREDRMLTGEMLTLDPDDELDLDGDGKKDIISYQGLPQKSDLDYYNSCTLTVNNSSIEYDGDNVKSTLYAGSLDGKALQLMIMDYGPSADPSLRIYLYNGKELTYAGEIPSYDYSLNKDGFTALCESYHIQSFRVPFYFKLENGLIKQIEQDLYPQGNTVKVLQDITLYEDNNENTLGITLTAGNEVIIVGSDLKEWVYIKDIKSGNFGWLKTKDDVNNCLLPDGRAVPAVELFEGLVFYG